MFICDATRNTDILKHADEHSRQGIGARVSVTDNNGGKQIFDISTASSYLSSNDVRVIAGVGSVSKVKTIEVKWPSGLIQKIPNPRLNHYVTISEANANQPRGNGR